MASTAGYRFFSAKRERHTDVHTGTETVRHCGTVCAGFSSVYLYGEKAALPTKARDLYTHSAYEYPIADGALTFQEVAPHDSVFLILSCP